MPKPLQIRLTKPSSESGGVGGGETKLSPSEIVKIACPDHLVLADLPVAKGIGPVTTATTIKTLGRRSRRRPGEMVNFCVRCDFPIAIYGRLNPCEHAFCLDCAKDSICHLCYERVKKIQKIKKEAIFICTASDCLKSFLKVSEFETHIHDSHPDLHGSSSRILTQQGYGRHTSNHMDLRDGKGILGPHPFSHPPPRPPYPHMLQSRRAKYNSSNMDPDA